MCREELISDDPGTTANLRKGVIAGNQRVMALKALAGH